MIGVGFLVALFFRHYTGSLIPLPWLFYVVAALLIGRGIWLVSLSSFHAKAALQYEQEIAVLKQYGLRIKVDPLQCEIKENVYVEELRRDEGEELALSALELNIPAVSLFQE